MYAAEPLGGHSLTCGKMLTAYDISFLQGKASSLPVGGRIAFWAEEFLGVPYDTDPLGAYVRSEKVVCDSEVDCMYLVFRAVELATSRTPDEAVERALDLRFKTKGRVEGDRVVNYDERFDYAEDMVASGKWGEDVTATLGRVDKLAGSRGRESYTYLPMSELSKLEVYGRLKNGDLVFFMKNPAKRVVGEAVGHLGIIEVEGKGVFLIHASGTKKSAASAGGGFVKKTELRAYLRGTAFIGVQVTRFTE